MTIQQIERTKQSKILDLDKIESKGHYDLIYSLFYISAVPIVFILKAIFERKYSNIFPFLCSICFFLLLSVIAFYIQRNKLKMTELATNYSKYENYNLTKLSLLKLGWNICDDRIDLLKATNPNQDFRTWGNEMITIIICDELILINSICNTESINQSFLSLGKNKQNVSLFIKTFSETKIDDI